MDEDVMHVNVDPDAEIDPDIFVKCRLCITSNGVFQIVPAVQDQIKFCFDITVKMFDGLPQVVCKTCKATLKQYQLTKNTFISNQTILEEMRKRKLQTNETEKIIDKPFQTKRRRIRIESESSESQGEETSQTPNATQVASSKEGISWKALYDKIFVCRFCGGVFQSKWRLKKHKKSHKSLLSCYEKYKINHCTVKLAKIDLRPNMTGETTTVVLNPTNIISEPGDPSYFISFVPNKNNSHFETHIQNRSNAIGKRSGKRSRSSSRDTLVIEDADDEVERADNESDEGGRVKDTNELISVDDSSTNDSVNNQSTEPSHGKSELQQSDLAIIQNIITMCQSKYVTENKAKNEKETVPDSSLLRKLLSIGTKIMTGAGSVITSPGLLKFLQHENLSIQWTPMLSSNPNSNYVRISTGVNEPKDLNYGWRIVDSVPNSDDIENIPLTAKNNNNITSQIEVPPPYVEKPIPYKESTPCVEKQEKKLYNKAEITLYQPPSDSDLHVKKLLNANPVNNPKQLPKKPLNVETKPNIAVIKVANKVNEGNGDSNLILIDSDDDEGATAIMPIITSTESLATSAGKQQPESIATPKSENIAASSTTAFPRIKCKPVSELMATTETARQLLPQNLTVGILPPVSNGMLIVPENVKLKVLPNIPQGHINLQNMFNSVTPMAILTTTTTNEQRHESSSNDTTQNKIVGEEVNKPVQYFQRLLGARNISLISDISKEALKSFTCLVKFKLDVRQQDKSVVISLALYALNDKFCIKLKKPNHEEIDINSLPAHWQLTIIKNFQGQVSEKILNCALKVSPTLYENAKTFDDTMKQIVIVYNNKTI